MVRQKVREARKKSVQKVSKWWADRAPHLLGTKASFEKTNTLRKVLTMESTTQVNQRMGQKESKKKQLIPSRFTELCPPELLLRRVAEAGGRGQLEKERGWQRFGLALADEVGFETAGYATRMGDLVKRYYLSQQPVAPDKTVLIAERNRRRLNMVDGSVAGPRPPTVQQMQRRLGLEQSVRAGQSMELAGRRARVVDVAQASRRKFEEAVEKGGVVVPPGEGEFEMTLCISTWSDGGSKNSKGFYAETVGFIDDGRAGVITRDPAKKAARADALERIITTLGWESKQKI